MRTVPKGGARDGRAVYEGPHATEAFQRRSQEADSQPLQHWQAQARDQEEDEGRRDLPGRQLGPHTGDGEAKVNYEAQVGQEEAPGYVQTGGNERAEGKAEG